MRLDAEHALLFDTLYRKHRTEVFRLCLKFAAGQRAWALDRTQDVFMTLAAQLSELSDTNDLGGWLYRVSVNHCYKTLRRERGWLRVVDRLREAAPVFARTPEPNALARRDLGTLREALLRLPAKERALVTLVYIEGKTQTEAADLLGLSRGYVSKLHDRALSALQTQDWELAYGR